MDKVSEIKYTLHQEKAMALFKDGCNCAQAVLVAFTDATNMDMESSLKIASSFGGGMGKLREVCGAVSAMFMIAGIKYGYSNVEDKDAKNNHDKLVQELATEFKKHTGSIVCRNLLGTSNRKEGQVLSEGTTEYYSKRPCRELVGLASRIIDEKLLNGKKESEK